MTSPTMRRFVWFHVYKKKHMPWLIFTGRTQASGKPMCAQVRLPEPIIETVLTVEPNKKVLGPKLKSAPKGALKELCDKLEAMTAAEATVPFIFLKLLFFINI
jgi:hypothetical protein